MEEIKHFLLFLVDICLFIIKAVLEKVAHHEKNDDLTVTGKWQIFWPISRVQRVYPPIVYKPLHGVVLLFKGTIHRLRQWKCKQAVYWIELNCIAQEKTGLWFPPQK